MNSKILNPNLYQLSQLKKSITRWIYSASQSKLNDKKLSSPSSSPLNSQLLLNNSNNHFQLTQVRWTLRGGAGYTKFGHGKIKPKISKYGYFWYAILATGFLFVAFFDTESFMFRGREPSMRLEEMKQWYSTHSNSKAKEIDSSTKIVDEDQLISEESQLNDDIVSELNDDDVVDNVKEKKEKITFRNRKIIQYENRIRQYSTPDKIFRYFATLSVWNEKLDDYEVYMTPEDFVRSITYGAKQPEGLGLDRYIRFDPQMQKLETNIGDDSIFRILNRQGIISFTDYIFLLTLLSTPTRHFEIAFYMFDEDGSGNIDLAEFEQLQAIIRNQTSSGQRHRDTRMTGSVIKDNHHLNEYFFGKELSELLTVDKFVSFQRRLQAEVIRMEFELCNLRTRESDGERVMSEMTFAEMILAYAGLGPSKTKKMLKKIASLYEGENSKQSKGITLRDYEDFFQILRSIHDIDTALKFYSIAGASIDKSILKHVSKTVANINLSDHVIDVIFNLFDENGDGKLTQKEFIKVMKKRWSRGLQQPKDTGFVKFIEALMMCSKEAVLSSPS